MRPDSAAAAVFSMQVFMTSATSRTVIFDRSYSETVYLADRSPASVVKALSQAFTQSLASLERDLRALQLKP
jgi:ABC-type uncharacterized transport system auxiliary subunit